MLNFGLKSCFIIILILSNLLKVRLESLKRLNQPLEEWRVPFFSYTFC